MFVMKDGNEVPPPLAEALERDSYAAAVFEHMRPSCQKRYAAHILESKNEETARTRAFQAIEQIRVYGQKHKISEPPL